QKLLEEQQKVQGEAEKLDAADGPKDKTWKGKVVQLADQQFQLANDAQRLVNKLKKVSAEEAEKHPDIAKMMEEAYQIADENQLVGAMKNADGQLRDFLLKTAVQKNME